MARRGHSAEGGYAEEEFDKIKRPRLVVRALRSLPPIVISTLTHRVAIHLSTRRLDKMASGGLGQPIVTQEREAMVAAYSHDKVQKLIKRLEDNIKEQDEKIKRLEEQIKRQGEYIKWQANKIADLESEVGILSTHNEVLKKDNIDLRAQLRDARSEIHRLRGEPSTPPTPSRLLHALAVNPPISHPHGPPLRQYSLPVPGIHGSNVPFPSDSGPIPHASSPAAVPSTGYLQPSVHQYYRAQSHTTPGPFSAPYHAGYAASPMSGHAVIPPVIPDSPPRRHRDQQPAALNQTPPSHGHTLAPPAPSRIRKLSNEIVDFIKGPSRDKDKGRDKGKNHDRRRGV
ncbi:uncharacterized protein BXZ73DRAFT_99392 [Epithele typhae]|uniref:uncharacterized protein n=1 Tax=Epithele typhae TaxID=378194 RepID=UPI0020082F0C|nr:uncharacterized protein BXZ73DRAFT_99392 [Epithele typhae]KAH9939760.1 hypothetical protein BXZ73DRAFT_99392 [Epithele typhae]